jgi:hypothetical protein
MDAESDLMAGTLVMTAMLSLRLVTCAASIAARSPAYPEPTTIMSNVIVSVVQFASGLAADVAFAMLHEYKSE